MNTRRQLTLFVKKDDAQKIEYVRKTFNPAQRQLIDCHVTLCREDELEDLVRIMKTLQTAGNQMLTLRFGPVARFSNNNGVWPPSAEGNRQFNELRKTILGSVETPESKHVPHITLMHPGNSQCTDAIFDSIQKMNLPKSLTFDTVSLIEQVAAGHWQTLASYPLTAGK